ncbi:MAG: Ig-like domain-containing protein, partial [Planctomycetaceae bacterium]
MLRRLAADWITHWARQAFRPRPRQPRQRPLLRQPADTLEPRLLLAAPVANPDQYPLAHDRSFTPLFGVLQNDTDADFELLAAQLVSGPANGTLTLQANGLFTYAPQAGFLGIDQFTYVAADATSTSLPTTVTLTVTNSVPVAQADTFAITRDLFDSVTQGAPRLTANDTDRDGDGLTAQLVTPPSHGLLAVNTDGTWRYTPEPNWFGTDTATYRASDGLAASDPVTITFQVISPFSAASNLPDVPLAGLESQGELATSLLTGEAVVTATAGRQTLVYSSLAADPRPVIAVETTFANPPGPNANSVPDRIEAQLTFNGVAGPKVVYATSTLRNNDPLRFALQADARGLATGLYAYRVRLVAYYGTQTTTRDFMGTTAVVNRQASEFGPGWSLAGFDRLVNIPAGTTSSGTTPAGQLLVLGTGGALFFEKTGATTFASPAGPLAFHTLVQEAGGNFTLISPAGDRQIFNSTGQLTQLVDFNGNATTLTYLSGLLSTITDPFTRKTTFTYASGKLASVTDFAGKITTLTRETGTARLLSVSTPDPDGSGSLVSLVTSYTYDSRHKLSTITAPGNQLTQLAYASSGRLAQMIRPDASARQFSPRQTAGLVDLSTGVGTSTNPAPLHRDGPPATLVTNEFSQQTRVRVDRFGNEIFRQSALGFVTQTVRDLHGRPLEIIAPDPDGDAGPLTASVTRFQYDRSNLAQLTAADGGVWSFTHDFALNRPLAQTDPRGQTTRFTYDAKGNRLTETDPLGVTTQFGYSAKGQLLTITQADPVTGAVGLGPKTTFVYDTRNRLTSITYPTLAKRSLTYDTSDNLLTDTDELGRKTTYTYDALNRPTSTTLPDPVSLTATTGPVSRVVYDKIGLIGQTIDPLGQITQYTYDPQRNWLLQVTAPDPDGPTGSDVAPVVNFTYDVAGRQLTQTEPLGAVTQWEYDADSRVTRVTLPDPDGTGGVAAPQQTIDYDRAGRVIATTDPLGRTTRTSYDAVGRVVAQTSPLGFVTRNTYDLAGNLVTQTLPDPDGAGPQSAPVKTNTYDALNRVISQTDPRGQVTQAQYDALGRMVAVTQPDPDGSGPLTAPVWQWAYNSRGWVTSTTDPLGFVTQYTRDNAGQVKVITDPDPDGAGSQVSPTPTYTYDLLGRVKSVKDPAGTTAYTYDQASRVTSITDPRGAVTQSRYDFLGRTVAITEPDPTVLTGGTARPVTTFRYDTAGQLLSRTDPVGATTSWTRDRLGRVIAETDPLGRTSTSTYDAGSQLVAVADPLGNQTQFVYDADGRQTQVTLPDPDGPGPLLSPTRQTTYDNLGRTIRTLDERQGETLFTYDLNSNLTSLRDPGGNTTSWIYDGLDRQIRETNALGASRVWEYSARGELTSQIDRNGRQTKWAYDGLGRATT